MYAFYATVALAAILLSLSRFLPRKQLTPEEQAEKDAVSAIFVQADDAERAASEAVSRIRETARISELVGEALGYMRAAHQAWNDNRFKDARQALETAIRSFNDVETEAGGFQCARNS